MPCFIFPMATDDAEFQEKSGLKRKLTGPPRLLLGKSRSPVQKEKSSDARKPRLDKNNHGTMDVAQEDQGNNEAGAQPQEIQTHGSDTAFAEDGDEIQTELGLEANSRQDDKKKLRRSKARARIRRIFSSAFMCIRRNKEESSLQNVQANNDKLYSRGVTQGCERGTRKFCSRLWPVFKKRSSRGKQQGQCGETVNEIPPATSDQFVRTVDDPETSGHDAQEQLNESSMTQEEIAGNHDLNSKDEGTEIIMLSADVSVDLHAKEDACESNLSCVTDEEGPPDRDPSHSQLTCLEESNSNDGTSPKYIITEVVDLDKTVPSAHQCKPVITIEDTSDEENHELFENPQCNSLAALLSLNGPCYDFKTKDTLKTLGQNDFSELLLVQTALSLVQTAIRSAVEQLSAEGHRIDQERS